MCHFVCLTLDTMIDASSVEVSLDQSIPKNTVVNILRYSQSILYRWLCHDEPSPLHQLPYPLIKIIVTYTRIPHLMVMMAPSNHSTESYMAIMNPYHAFNRYLSTTKSSLISSKQVSSRAATDVPTSTNGTCDNNTTCSHVTTLPQPQWYSLPNIRVNLRDSYACLCHHSSSVLPPVPSSDRFVAASSRWPLSTTWSSMGYVMLFGEVTSLRRLSMMYSLSHSKWVGVRESAGGIWGTLPSTHFSMGNGGMMCRSQTTGNIHAIYESSHQMYDIKTCIWSIMASPRHPRCGAAIVSLDHRIIVIGGYQRLGSGPRRPMQSCEAFDTRSMTWSSLATRTSIASMDDTDMDYQNLARTLNITRGNNPIALNVIKDNAATIIVIGR
jgi:hypothetical protein